MSRMGCVKKQSAQTWNNLHCRLRATPFSYNDLFPQPVGNFIKNHAIAISSCEGFIFNSLLATTGYVLSEKTRVTYQGYSSKTNMYVVFVGPPSTGKSQAIAAACLDPLSALTAHRDDSVPIVLGKSTSAGLVNRLSQGGTMLVSSEIYDVLNKMIKTDGETGSGDISMLAQIFSGERVTVSYATQKSREIAADTSFCILGAIQPKPTAQLVTSLDSGNGFLERLILSFPDCLRPTPTATRSAMADLDGKPSLTDVILMIAQIHDTATEYVFDHEGEHELDLLNEAYIESINAALVNGAAPPQSKKLDLVIRMAPIVHVLTSVMKQMLEETEVTRPTRVIKKATLDKAITFVDFCESQKETYLCELHSITNGAVTPDIQQPKNTDVTKAVIKTPGPIITYRSFKASCSRPLRSVSRAEYDNALRNLETLGTSTTHRMQNGGRQVSIFVKKNPTTINWNDQSDITESDFTKTYEKKIPSCITQAMQDSLVSTGIVTQDVLNK